MGRQVVLGEIISTVEFPESPVQIELLLGDAIAQPVIAHIKRFWLFHANLGVEDAMCCGIVGFKRSTSDRLRVSHFFELRANGDSISGIEKTTAGFGFGSGGSKGAECFAEIKNRTVAFGVWRITSGRVKSGKEKMTCSTTASIGENKVGCIIIININ
jgi:hypothetical protein